jgi:hypothetical protein
VLAIFTAVLGSVAIVQIRFLIRADITSRRAAIAARRSANAARQTIKTMESTAERQLRAYAMSPTQRFFTPTMNINRTLELNLKITGKHQLIESSTNAKLASQSRANPISKTSKKKPLITLILVHLKIRP